MFVRVQIGNSILDVANFGLLLLLLMYVFALIGMQFFATKYRFDADGNPVEWQPHVYNYTVPPHAPWTPESPYTISRSNFDDTLSAFTTVFQCLTEESWNFVMYDGVRSIGWGALVYFLAVMIIGNIIILNLFLAILLGNFSLDEQQTDVDVALLKGQQKIIDTIARSSIRKLSTVIPFGSPSSGHLKSDSPKSSLHLQTDFPPPLVRQNTPTKRGSRVRRRSNVSMNSSRRLLDDLGDDDESANPVRPQSPQRGVENLEKGRLLRASSIRSFSSKAARLPEKTDHERSEQNNISPVLYQNHRRLSSTATLPEIRDNEESEEVVNPALQLQHQELTVEGTLFEGSTHGGENVEKVSPGCHPSLQVISSRAKLTHELKDHDVDGPNTSSRPPPALPSMSSRPKLSNTRSHFVGGAAEVTDTTPSPSSPTNEAPFKSTSAINVVHRNSVDSSAPPLENEIIVYDSNRSLFLFKSSGFVRRFCHQIIRSSYFDHMILVIIFVGSILLAVDNPLNDPSSTQSIALGIMDNVFNAIFLVEMLLKVIDLGFIFNGPQSYLRDPWNVLDLTILSFSGATLFSSSKTLRSLRSFRTLRALVRTSTSVMWALLFHACLTNLAFVEANVWLLYSATAAFY